MTMPAEATGEMVAMGQDGDSKHFWNTEDGESVEQAREVFGTYTTKGFKAFLMNEAGDKGEPLDDFDPAAGSILFVPPMAGG